MDNHPRGEGGGLRGSAWLCRCVPSPLDCQGHHVLMHRPMTSLCALITRVRQPGHRSACCVPSAGSPSWGGPWSVLCSAQEAVIPKVYIPLDFGVMVATKNVHVCPSIHCSKATYPLCAQRHCRMVARPIHFSRSLRPLRLLPSLALPLSVQAPHVTMVAVIAACSNLPAPRREESILRCEICTVCQRCMNCGIPLRQALPRTEVRDQLC